MTATVPQMCVPAARAPGTRRRSPWARLDVTLADGVNMRTAPQSSQLFGDSAAADFAQSSYLGYQITIKGQPQAGDTFTVDFNLNASNDNRNALFMAGPDRKSGGEGES